MKTWTGELSLDENQKIIIVAARFNALVTEKLVVGAEDTFLRSGGLPENLEIAWVPGAFEIPLIAKKLAKSNNYSAIVCLGAVIRGETSHYDYVCNEAAKGINRVGLDHEIPVIFGILTTDTVEQALNRSGLKAGNKGSECMGAAIEMSNLAKKLEF